MKNYVWPPDQIIYVKVWINLISNVKKKKQRHDFADKSLCSQSYDFSSGHVQMWELHHKEGWAPKNWCFQIVMLEKTLESPLDSKEIKPANPKKKSPLNIHWKDGC